MRQVLILTMLGAALAASAQEKDIEPAVTTSSSALTPPVAPAAKDAAAPAPAADQAADKTGPAADKGADKAAAGKPSGSGATAPPAAKTAAPGKTGAKSTAHDQIQLDTTQITGNRELPNVMYVVPWKKPELGDLGGRPARSLVDDALAPVDRDVFRRQNRYFTALQADSAPRSAVPAAPAQSGAPPP
jgi:hypothetical protein